jgi:hypothetical protein
LNFCSCFSTMNLVDEYLTIIALLNSSPWLEIQP